MRRLTLLLAVLAAPIAAQTRVENPYRGVMQDRTAHSPGEARFVEKCGMCHRQMGMGTVLLARRMPAGQAMLELRSDLTPELITAAVRGGIGNMPRITRGEVSARDLAAIEAYLTDPARKR